MKLGLILWLWLPLLALADGKIFPSTAFPEQIRIPEQEALIHWSNGVERLVIETRFDAKGTNFAWVIPLPARPKIEAVTPGVFPTLRSYFAPEVKHETYRLYLWVLGAGCFIVLVNSMGSPAHFRRSDPLLAAGIALAQGIAVRGSYVAAFVATFTMVMLSTQIARRAGEKRKRWCAVLGGALACLVAADIAIIAMEGGGVVEALSADGFLLRFLAMIGGGMILGLAIVLAVPPKARRHVGFCVLMLAAEFHLVSFFAPASLGTAGNATASNATEAGVVVERKRVGSYETAIIESKDANALRAWFQTNGYAMPPSADSVVAEYVREGWVFAAAKLRRDAGGSEQSSVHPLSFQFATAQSVFPMRLTGVESGPVQVALYLFGEERATAEGFRVAHCERPEFSIPSTERYRIPPSRRQKMDIQHPLIREWVQGAKTATKLVATLSPDAMKRDVAIRWVPFEAKRTILFSRRGAITVALNFASVLAAVGLLVAARRFRFDALRNRIRVWCLLLTGVSLLVGVGIYVALPVIPARVVHGPGYRAFVTARSLRSYVASELSDETVPQIAPARAAAEKSLREEPDLFQNPLQGRIIREEDSPGNYLFRQTTNGIEMIFIDFNGGEFPLEPFPDSSQRRR